MTSGIPNGTVTLINFVALAVFVVLQPIAGSISGRIGRRPLLLLFGIGGTVLTAPLLTLLARIGVLILRRRARADLVDCVWVDEGDFTQLATGHPFRARPRERGSRHLIELRGARMRVLLVEDDDGVASALVEVLGAHGHRATRCRLGADALTAHRDADLVLLDLGLPDIEGLTVLLMLRQVSPVPVIVLTARGDERSMVRLLLCGADDYMVKPIRLPELLARMEAVIRRAAARADHPQEVVWAADVCVDLGVRTVEVAGKPITLTTKEFNVLAVLARHVGQAVSRQQIMYQVWGNAHLMVSRSLDVHIATLRNKLGRPGLLVTIRGFGYRFG